MIKLEINSVHESGDRKVDEKCVTLMGGQLLREYSNII